MKKGHKVQNAMLRLPLGAILLQRHGRLDGGFRGVWEGKGVNLKYGFESFLSKCLTIKYPVRVFVRGFPLVGVWWMR